MQKIWNSLFYYFSPGFHQNFEELRKKGEKKKKIGENFMEFRNVSDSIPVENNKKRNEQPVSNSAPFSTSPVEKKKNPRDKFI